MDLKTFTLEFTFVSNVSDAEMEQVTPAMATDIFLEIKRQLRATFPQSHVAPITTELSSESIVIPDKVWEHELEHYFDCWTLEGQVREPLPEPTHTTPETVQ